MLISSIILEPSADAIKSRGALAHLAEPDWGRWVNSKVGHGIPQLPVLKAAIRRLLILGWLERYNGDLNSVARRLEIKKASLQREMLRLNITKNLIGDYE